MVFILRAKMKLDITDFYKEIIVQGQITAILNFDKTISKQ